MNQLFDTATPESVGIPSACLKNFLTRIEKQELPIHSAIIMKDSKVCMEAYYQPYTRDTLHRMFSITKSFVSLAIGLLVEDKQISLDDHIIDYFPEKLPKEGAFPYMKMLTIREMLAMTTCHDKNTYKVAGTKDWVGSFFTTPPDHIPGTNFSYDTASTHTLAGLVEKLTGMELIDYLRSKFLDEIDFSKDAIVLKDPVGVSMGGSGLCATPYDILKVMYIIAHDGQWKGKQLLPNDYIKTAKLKHSDPRAKQSTLEEMQGYGYQIWMTQNNGIVLFGMGGQLALYCPDKDIFMITTADAQGRQGGVQLIYDAFWDEVYDKISPSALPEDANAVNDLISFCNSRKLYVLTGDSDSTIINSINDINYKLDDNSNGFTSVRIHFNNNHQSGTFYYTNTTGDHSLDFAVGDNVIQQFPDYDLRCAVSGAWRLENYFLLKVQIIDTAIGNMYIALNYKDDYITVMFRKIEESLFTEYNGVISGKKQ
jgi:CubicO group peptidase (beta-lactamase class C family)